MAQEKPKVITIHKVRRTRKKILIDYSLGDESHTLKSRDNPLPAFDKAIEALVPLVLSICHLSDGYAENLKATGLTLTEKNMVTLVAQKSLSDAGGPFNIATPLRFLDHPEEEGTYTPALEDKQVALVDEVIEQAKQYVLGNRAQGQLAMDDDEDDEGEAEAENHAEDVKKQNEIAFAPDSGSAGKPAKKKRSASVVGAGAGK